MGSTGIDQLSARERTVLRLVQRGLQTDEIARELARSPNTIENQIANARRKLGGVTRRQAARLLLEAEHSGSPTNQPFVIPVRTNAGDQPGCAAEEVREERAIFVPNPAMWHGADPQGAPSRSQLRTIAMIVGTTLGVVVMLIATPSLVASFRALTLWIIDTFY